MKKSLLLILASFLMIGCETKYVERSSPERIGGIIGIREALESGRVDVAYELSKELERSATSKEKREARKIKINKLPPNHVLRRRASKQ